MRIQFPCWQCALHQTNDHHQKKTSNNTSFFARLPRAVQSIGILTWTPHLSLFCSRQYHLPCLSTPPSPPHRDPARLKLRATSTTAKSTLKPAVATSSVTSQYISTGFWPRQKKLPRPISTHSFSTPSGISQACHTPPSSLPNRSSPATLATKCA